MPKDIAVLSLQEGAQIFLQTINYNITHPDYQRVQEIAKDYMIYLTGEGVADKLLQFVPRETIEQFTQRLRLTKSITPDMAGGCTKYMYKVGRTPAAKIYSWNDATKTEENKKKLLDAAGKFYGKQSVDQYLTYRMVELDSTDPNAFIVVEFTTPEKTNVVNPRDPESKAIPYPFEVNSTEAVNFSYKNNLLQFLVAKNYCCIKDKNGKECEAYKYTIYLSQNSIQATPIHKDSVEEWKRLNEYTELTDLDSVENLTPGKIYFFTTTKKGNSSQRYFSIQVYEHKIGFVPAQRVGTVRDLTTRGRTRVPLIHLAQPYFEKAIKTISEFDLTICLHVFPQKIQYSESCPGYITTIGREKDYRFRHAGSTTDITDLSGDQEEEILMTCKGGFTPTGHRCKQCNGSGFVVHKSASDVIQIAMPKRGEQLMNLENLLVYKYPPIDLVKFQKDLALYEYPALAMRAVYNSETFTAEKIMQAATATGENIDLDKVYDTLKPFADNYSEMWVFVMSCIAELCDLGGEDLKIIHQFPNDFKMKSLTQLLTDLKMAGDSGAPSHVKKAITRDIVRKYYIDDPQEILRIETKDRYNPFLGKTSAEVQFIMSNNATTEKLEVFYNHFDLIFSDIEYETKSKNEGLNFYMMEEKMQRELIDKKVDEYVKALTEQNQKAMADAFKLAQASKVEEPANDL